MSKIITIYCEGKKGSPDYDILVKTVGTIGATRIKPIGSKYGANAIIEYQEKGAKISDFYCFFRDRDFDFPVPQNEELYFDGNKTYCSYRTTIENYLFDTNLFLKFLEAEQLNSIHGINTEDDVRSVFIETAKKLKDYQAVRYTLGQLRFPNSFGTTWIKEGSGHLPPKLNLEYCISEGWKLICDVVSRTDIEWAEDNFQSILKKYLELFNDDFFKELKFLIYFQGKDFAKALTNKLQNFPLKNYYKFAIKHFDYKKFKDLVELRTIIEKTYNKD